VFWNPWLKNGTRCRPLYEDQNARLSILANGSPEGRIRLCRQIKPDTEKPLADGAGHTFSVDRRSCRSGGSLCDGDLGRHREDDVEVADGKQVGLSRCEPLARPPLHTPLHPASQGGVRYLGIEVDDALVLSEQTDL